MADEAVLELIYRINAKIATIKDHPEWVNAVATKIDPDNQMNLAISFDHIIRHLMKTYPLIGASSNNLFWKATDNPVRVILFPTVPRRYITLVNPQINALSGKDFNSIEACGSIPDECYMVKRKPYVALSGYTLENEFVELSFGSVDADLGPDPVLTPSSRYEWIIQHEMDHLEGITIKDKGLLFDLNSLVS